MRYFTQFFILCMISAACCCSKGTEAGGGSTEPEAPSALSVNPASVEATPEAKTQEIAISSPERPRVEIPSDAKSWLSYEDGVFSKYRMTVKLKLAANETYEPRSAEVTVSAKGCTSVKISVSQEGKKVIKDPVLPSNTAVARTLELGLGWNMGNHFDAYANGVASDFPSR